MAAHEISTHDADQIIRHKQRLGLDYQGRHPEAAHTATEIGADDADDWEPLSLRDNLMFWVPVLTATAVVVAGLLRLVGVWSS